MANATPVVEKSKDKPADPTAHVLELLTKIKDEQTSLRSEQDGMRKQLSVPMSRSGYGAAQLFANAADHKAEYSGGFKCMAHQLECIVRERTGTITPDEKKMLIDMPNVLAKWYQEKGYNQRFIEKATGMSEAVGPDGGFLLAPTYAAGILEIMHDFDNLLERCDKYEMSGPSMRFRAVDETSLATTRRGGVLGYWVDEGGTLTQSKPKFRSLELIPHKVAVLTYLTDELLSDGPMAEQYVSRYAAEELMFQINNAVIRGTGAGQPLGVLNSACTVSVAKETGQPANTILNDNLQKMYSRLHASSRNSAAWFLNQDTWPQIFQLNQPVGVGGFVTFLPMDQGMTKTPGKQILGLPVIEIPWCATLGTVGDIMLLDLKQYIAATRGSVMAANSIHIAFLTDETAFRWTMRVAGMPWWSSALTPFQGTATQSPFITLASRA